MEHHRLILFVLVIFSAASAGMSQQHRIGFSIYSIWPQEDFYQGFSAKSDPNIQAIYQNASEKNVVEQYQFIPFLGGELNYSYVKEKRGNRKVSTAISSGLGFANTSFEITTPAITRLLDFGTISTGVGKIYTYRFNYIDIKVGLDRIHSSSNKKTELIYGVGVKNMILVASSVDVFDQFRGTTNEDVFETRMLTRQNYILMPYLNLGFGFSISKNTVIHLKMIGGVAPTNILRNEPTIEATYDRSYFTNGTSAYEETSSLNMFIGGEFGLQCLL